MSFIENKKIYMICAIILIVLCAVSLVFATMPSASAEVEIKNDTIKVAHITDLHYFSYEDSYYATDTDPNYKNTDVFKELQAETKFIRETGTTLNATIINMLAEKPDYLVISGDLTRNGEIHGHYDVANALRYLQNEMRKAGKPNFQVFVVPGNHDLYNKRAVVFNQDATVSCTPDYITTAEAFATIYNGLGYKDLTVEELNATDIGRAMLSYYNDGATQPYAFTSKYIESKNASNISYDYYSDVIGYPDSTDRKLGCLSYVAKITDRDYTFICYDATDRDKREDAVVNNSNNTNIEWTQITGGQIANSLNDWVIEKTADSRTNKETIFASLHFNVAPHYSMEEQYTKDFTLYNWEDTAKRMADEVGIRYVFTGHMHANDISQFVSYNGNVIIDFETASNVSITTPTRFTDIKRINNNGILNEDVSTVVTSINSLKNVQSIKIDMPSDEASLCLFNNIEDVQGFMQNKYENMAKTLIDAYVSEDLITTVHDLVAELNISSIPLVGGYKNAIVQLADALVDQIFHDLDYNIAGVEADSLVDFVKKMAYKDDVLNMVIYSEEGTDYTLEKVFLWAYTSHLIGDESSVYDDSTVMGRAAIALEKKLIDGSVVDALLNGLLEPLLYEKNSLIHQILNYEFDVSSCTDKNFNSLIGVLIPSTDAAHPKNNGNKLVVNNLLSKNLKDKNSTVGKLVGSVLSGSSIGATVTEALNMGVEEWAKDTLTKYMTDSFFTGIGGILADTMASFATDGSSDTVKAIPATYSAINASEYKLVKYVTSNDSSFDHTYSGSALTIEQNAPTYEDGRLPSILTSTFGDNAATSQNFKWYTNWEVGGKFVYREVGTNDWKEATVNTTIKAVEVPLIDLGLFATTTKTEVDGETVTFENKELRESIGLHSSVKFAAIHDVSLTGLKANTKYEYKVYGTYGSEEYCLQDYVEDWNKDSYSFKTALAKGDSSSFNFLAISDIQGTIKSSYELARDAINASKAISNFDFIVNCGDVTDNGGNIKQWSYAQNVLSTIMGNTSTVISAGNHDKSSYSLASYYNFGNVPSSQSLETGIYYSFDYGTARFIVLNTNDTTAKGELADKQYKWLSEELDAANADADIKNIIVMMHKSLYSVGSHVEDTDVLAMKAQLVPLFYEKGVDLVLAGHDHTYSVTQVLDADGNAIEGVKKTKNGFEVKAGTKGVVYMTLGTVSDKYYEYRKVEATEEKLSEKNTIFHQLNSPMFTSINMNSDGSFAVDTYAYVDDQVVSFDDYKKDLEGKGLQPWAIALIVVGSVLVVGAGVAVTIILVKRKKKDVDVVADK